MATESAPSAVVTCFRDTTNLQGMENLNSVQEEAENALPDTFEDAIIATSFLENSTLDDHAKLNSNLLVYGPPPAQYKSRREKEAIRKRVYHQRLKNERKALRETVEELSKQIEELTQAKQMESTGNLGLFNSVWRDFALREQDLRLKSEAEQLQLLAAAEAKASYIEQLCKELPTPPTDFAVDVATELPSKESKTVQSRTDPPFDFTMYRGHLRRVNESYTQVDEVFRDFPMLLDGVTSSVQRRENDGELEYFQHLNKMTEPFCYEHTSQKMWQLAKYHHRQYDREDFQEVADSEDIIVVRFRAARVLMTGSTVSVLQRYVIRRFVESTRTVFVWKTHSEGEGIFRGMHSDETGWVCLQPATSEDNTTEIKVCVRQVPMTFSISGPGESIVGEFHQVLQSFATEDSQEITAALGSLLLEDTLAGIEV